MTIFAISTHNYITVLDSVKDTKNNPETEHFSSLKDLTRLAAQWPTSRLIEIWNNLPGTTPVKKFTDRKTAVIRIWKQIGESSQTTRTAKPTLDAEHSDATVAEQAPHVATSTDEASCFDQRRESAPKAHRPREGSKTVTVLGLLKRRGGATATELMAATGWQAHSVRGFLSGIVVKKMGLKLASIKAKDGVRHYSIQA